MSINKVFGSGLDEIHRKQFWRRNVHQPPLNGTGSRECTYKMRRDQGNYEVGPAHENFAELGVSSSQLVVVGATEKICVRL